VRKPPKHFIVVEENEIRFNKNVLKNYIKLKGCGDLTYVHKEKNLDVFVTMTHRY